MVGLASLALLALLAMLTTAILFLPGSVTVAHPVDI
jgi:hypothetical protein